MKKALIILALAMALMVILAVVGIGGIIGLFNSSVERMQDAQDRRNTEVERIRALPELAAVIVAGAGVQAPFSHKEVACYALVQAERVRLSGPAGGRSTGSSGKPHLVYENDVVLVGGPGLALSIQGIQHPVLPDSAILFWRADGSPNAEWFDRLKGRSFSSNRWRTAYNDQYDEDQRAVMTLRGRSGLLDRYINKPSTYHEPDVYLEELLFQVGDTIIFKGRIEEGAVVPLF
jgi:hypothetical protein